MAWFGRKKARTVTYKDVAPDGLFDLHSHVLPQLDDGSQIIEESLEMLDGLARLGFVKVAATPHFSCRNLAPDLEQQHVLINQIDERRGSSSLQLVPGAESLFDDFFIKAESRGAVPSLAEHPTYLVEFGLGPGSVPIGVENVVFKLQAKDKTLILAHPERLSDFQRRLDRLIALRNGGMILQIDVMSLVGRNGGKAKKCAYRILDEGLVDLAATDIHSQKDLPIIESALEALNDWDAAEFQRLFSQNPQLVLESRADEVMRYE